MSHHFQRVNQAFDKNRFVKSATNNLDSLELKERATQIRQALETFLPPNYRDACQLMLAALHPEKDVDLSDKTIDEQGIRGWAIMPMADFVACQGLDDFDFSMDVLKHLTPHFSSEFAVCSFLLKDTNHALDHIKDWAKDANSHVRRLASEATRPRLPWSFQLPMFMTDPSSLLPILECLKR